MRSLKKVIWQATWLVVIVALWSYTAAFAGEFEFTFTSSFDGSTQQAVAYVPDGLDTTQPHPLLVVVHYMGGNRFTAQKSGYYPECDTRGWIAVCPELHGHREKGQNSMAALEAQHDAIDAMGYMQMEYSVDSSRVYVAGRSMGGMLAQMMAAKYPDIFAAAVSGEGISDLALWDRTTLPSLRANSRAEVGDPSPETAFDYARRSSVNYASNLAYVPVILWHGTNDTWVPPEQSEIVNAEVKKYNRFAPDVCWLYGAAHCPANFDARWICDKLVYYQNVPEAGFDTPERFFNELTIVTDEAKRYFWLDITPADPNRFARVTASIKDGLLFIRTENVAGLAIDLDHVSKQSPIDQYDVEPDTDLQFLFVRADVPVMKQSFKKGTVASGTVTLK